jgi:hypothetical protein
MVSEDQAKQLHDRATRGKPLSAEEYSLLEAWYTLQDSLEQEALGLTTTERNVADLRTQIEILMDLLATATKRIQEIAAENDNLRQEIYGPT